MAKLPRNPVPERVVWHQDDVTHSRFYWLAVDKENQRARAKLVATRTGQQIEVESDDLSRVTIRVNDAMLNLDEPVRIQSRGQELFSGTIRRTVATMANTLAERGDQHLMFSGEATVDLPKQAP